jgi:murein DD-endopeptidase MepM/ murein hydrolase activator NlpD
VCPVGDPHAVSDGFGAPRYGGGYHLHAGNDIIAPQGIPIYATFDGVARDASNSLGGLAVIVEGSLGYTYNAHMVSISELGPVSAGDVIGLVGATGDTSTPHNDFEWHPNVIPDGWPASPYGVSVVGSAVNPYPLLAAVC